MKASDSEKFWSTHHVLQIASNAANLDANKLIDSVVVILQFYLALSLALTYSELLSNEYHIVL